MGMDPDAADDRDLARAFLRGEEAAFRALYGRHAPSLHLFVLRVLGGSARDAEDALQETWLRAAERLTSFRWESSLRTWLSGIALNRCRELLRARSRDGEAPGEPPEPRSSAPAEEDRIDLERAVRALPDGYRMVFVLHDVEGRTHEEIGRLLGVEAATSKSQLSRARARLRERLAGRAEAP